MTEWDDYTKRIIQANLKTVEGYGPVKLRNLADAALREKAFPMNVEPEWQWKPSMIPRLSVRPSRVASVMLSRWHVH